MEFVAHNTDELTEIARVFLERFPQPEVFVLEGEMGAGKTTLIRAICASMGVEGASSPTYSLVNEYLTAEGIRIFHFDLYRIKSLEEAMDFGFEEYLDQGAYVFIEWPDKIVPLLGEHHQITIRLHEQTRVIEF